MNWGGGGGGKTTQTTGASRVSIATARAAPGATWNPTGDEFMHVRDAPTAPTQEPECDGLLCADTQAKESGQRPARSGVGASVGQRNMLRICSELRLYDGSTADTTIQPMRARMFRTPAKAATLCGYRET